MQIKYLHKNLYKLNRYFSRHFSEEKSNNRCIEQVKQWQMLRNEGVAETICQQIVGISRASYYRYKKRMVFNQRPKVSKRPKHVRKPEWAQKDFQQVLTRIFHKKYR